MWLISIFSLAFLPQSFGVQDGIQSLGRGTLIWPERLPDGGDHQNSAIPHLQVLSPPEASSGFDPVSRTTQAPDDPWQPTALSHPLEDTAATHWTNSWSPASNHPSNYLPGGQIFQTPGSLSYPTPQQKSVVSERPTDYALHHTHSQNTDFHIALSESERKALESISWDTFYGQDAEWGDHSLLYTTSPNLHESPRLPAQRVSPKLARASDLVPYLVAPPSGTETLPERHHPGVGANLPSATPGFSTASSRLAQADNELNRVELDRLSGNQPSDSFYLFDEDPSAPSPPHATSSPHGASPNLPSAFDKFPFSLSLIPQSWTEPFPNRHQQFVGVNFPSATRGSPTSFSRLEKADNELNRVLAQSRSDNQPSDSIQGLSTSSNDKHNAAFRPLLDQPTEKDQAVPQTTSRMELGSAKTKKNRFHKFHNNVSRSRRNPQPKKFTPVKSEELPTSDQSPYALMTDLSARMQKTSSERMVMIKKTVTKWLPVYKKRFESEPNNHELKAKLTIFFEQLWQMNTWLLHSFDFDILKKTEYLNLGNDHMMSWVVHRMLKPGDAHVSQAKTTDPTVLLQNEVSRSIFQFLGAQAQTESLPVQKRRRLVIKIDKESEVACRLAVSTLDAYYKSSNQMRYEEIFRVRDLPERLLHYARTWQHGNQGWWKKSSINKYGAVILPWSNSEIEKVFWDSDEEQCKRICEERLKELQQRAMDWRISAPKIRRNQ